MAKKYNFYTYLNQDFKSNPMVIDKDGREFCVAPNYFNQVDKPEDNEGEI